MASDQDKKKCWERTFDLASKRPEIDQAVAEVLQACTDQGLEEPATFAIRLSLEEAMANAMMHGNGGDETKRIILECQIDSGKVRMTIQDEGPGFDPETVPDPTADENLTIASGRGLALIKAFMTHVEIPRPGNRLELVFERS
ncbi:MAG: ATP-binding protein [Phycisphaerales bacterium]|nr:ATP-binding protein [Phycisphaerales bacterium]